MSDTLRCHFCEEAILLEKGTTPDDGMYAEEVGEFYNTKLDKAFLGHPDCVPGGMESIFDNSNPEWVMA